MAKKFLALALVLILTLALCGAASAFVSSRIVVKKGPYRTVVVKRYYYPRKSVVIDKKTVVYRPWKWTGSVRVMAVAAVMRQYPYEKAAVVATLPKDAEYEVTQRVNNWYLLKFDGKKGWVRKDAIRVARLDKGVKPAAGEKLQEESVKVPEDEQ